MKPLTKGSPEFLAWQRIVDASFGSDGKGIKTHDAAFLLWDLEPERFHTAPIHVRHTARLLSQFSETLSSGRVECVRRPGLRMQTAFTGEELMRFIAEGVEDYPHTAFKRHVVAVPRATLLKLIRGIALTAYGHDADRQRTTTAPDMARDCQQAEINLDDDTVRRILKEVFAKSGL